MKHLKINLIFAILTSIVTIKTYAYGFEVKNTDGVTIYYKTIENTKNVEVTYKGSGPYVYKNEYTGKVDIPESINYNGTTYRVTGIGDNAFQDCSNLTLINMPNSITSIGKSAFYGCVGLSEIDIPDAVTSIGGNAFYETGWYKSLPNGIIYFKNWLLGYKGSKPSGNVNINEGTIRLAGSAFSDCTDITSITIPNSVISISDGAFSGCSGLILINIPNHYCPVKVD